MCQMTNFRKVLGTCLAVFALMGAQSCNREVAEPSAVEGKTQAEETIYKEGNVEMPVSENLVFDAADENQLKALNATVSASSSAGANSRHAVDYGQEFPVICVIRSNNQADPVTYAELKVTKKSDGTYKMSQDRVHLAQGSTLAPGKKWYLMVVTQNAFNKNNGELSVNAGATENLSSSATRVMDIPSASPWIELPTFPNGQPKWSKDWDPARKKQKLTLYPQGVLCRATLRLDDAYKAKLGGDNVDLKITQLKVVSTALSFSGKFKFDEASLPDLTETSGRPTIAWEPTPTANTAKEYRALDANTPEYQKVFNNPNGVLQVSGSGSSATIFADSNNPTRVDKTNLPQGVQSIIFWAVPVRGVTNRHTTLIAETGSSSSAKVLPPSHTYIYGKKHTKDAAQGRAVYFDAVYYNPYTPLDYMAEYNLARKDPAQFRNGGIIPQGPSNHFAKNHGVDAFAMVKYNEVTTTNILNSDGRHYGNPGMEQFESIIPFQGNAAVNLISGNDVNNEVVNVALGSRKGATKFSSRRVGNVVYALALADFGGTQKYRVAYRYSGVDNPDAPTETTPTVIYKQILDPNRIRTRQAPYHYPSPYFEGDTPEHHLRKAFQIEAIQLGSNFVGGVGDIANEEFWTQQTVNKEKRILPLHYTSYKAYANPSDLVTPRDTKKWEALVKKYRVTKELMQRAIYYYYDHWGASMIAGAQAPTLYYLGTDAQGNPVVAACNGVTGWSSFDLRSTPSLRARLREARFTSRPFTPYDHP